MSEKQKINSYAIASLVLALFGLLSGVWILGLCGVASGEKFRRLNKQASGKLNGAKLALIGTILGIIPFLVITVQYISKEIIR